MNTPTFKQLVQKPSWLFAFGFGSGLAPKAPGTFGTLAAIPFYFLIMHLPVWQYLAVLVVTSVVGIWFCHVAAEGLGVHDHPGIVWDEMVGYWLTMFMAPAGWVWIVLGFVLFRVFDILKPWPIRWVDQRVHGGFGIMLDDILAAGFSWGFLQLIHRFMLN
ncbi:MAG: phosphatidylglycerophosphatase A [Cellvibrionaceae bacterium]